MIPNKPEGYKRILAIADVHLYHRTTPANHVLNTLDKYIFNYGRLADVDAVVIAGDLFDRWIKLAASNLLHEWAVRALTILKETNTALRIVEGTPSHDWKQAEYLIDINRINKLEADITYISDLSVVDDPVLGVIGYIPDECRNASERILRDFEECMTTKAITKVDFIFAHGFFDFQAPPNQPGGLDTKRFSNLTKHYVICGHDHRKKRSLKVIVPGSWDRCAHGEEDSKGGVIIDYNGNNNHVYFLPNPDALPYVKFNYLDRSDEAILKDLPIDLRSVSNGFVRFEVDNDTSLKEYFAELIRSESLPIDVVYKSNRLDVLVDKIFALDNIVTHITDSNISEMIVNELVEDKDIHLDVLKAEIETIRGGL